jgi:ribosomal protein S18 acetylase RimI-like enzyme
MPADREPAHIRLYRPGDRDALYAICLQTADSGQDGTGLFRDPRLPGDVYAAPYVTFEPSLAFVAEDAAGVGGYIVAALDSPAFGQRLEREWWPALRDRYPEPPSDQAERMSLPERYAVQDIHHPFGPPPQAVERFPSHLHINLVPRMQGRGAGRHLIATLLAALRDHGSRGVHLLVGHSNQRAAGFYRHIGFTELPATDVHIFGLNLTEETACRQMLSGGMPDS